MSMSTAFGDLARLGIPLEALQAAAREAVDEYTEEAEGYVLETRVRDALATITIARLVSPPSREVVARELAARAGDPCFIEPDHPLAEGARQRYLTDASHIVALWPPHADAFDQETLTRTLMAAWAEAEPNHSITQHPTSYVRTFYDMATAVRRLLTDTDQVSVQDLPSETAADVTAPEESAPDA